MDPRPRSEIIERVAPLGAAVAGSSPTLDELAIAIARMLQPDLDPLTVMTDLDDLAASCPTPTRDGIMNHLFSSGRMVGDRRTYHDWRNSCIDHVLAAGRGMPITLSVIGIEVARRLGVRLAGVGMPGHFLIGDPADDSWFADPFHGRTGLGRSDCQALLASIHGPMSTPPAWSDAFLRAIPHRFIAARILNNLKMSCERSRDAVRLAVVMQARLLLPELGDDPHAAIPTLAVFN